MAAVQEDEVVGAAEIPMSPDAWKGLIPGPMFINQLGNMSWPISKVNPETKEVEPIAFVGANMTLYQFRESQDPKYANSDPQLGSPVQTPVMMEFLDNGKSWVTEHTYDLAKTVFKDVEYTKEETRNPRMFAPPKLYQSISKADAEKKRIAKEKKTPGSVAPKKVFTPKKPLPGAVDNPFAARLIKDDVTINMNWVRKLTTCCDMKEKEVNPFLPDASGEYKRAKTGAGAKLWLSSFKANIKVTGKIYLKKGSKDFEVKWEIACAQIRDPYKSMRAPVRSSFSGVKYQGERNGEDDVENGDNNGEENPVPARAARPVFGDDFGTSVGDPTNLPDLEPSVKT